MSIETDPYNSFAKQDSMRVFYGSTRTRMDLEGAPERPNFAYASTGPSEMYLRDVDGTTYDVRLCRDPKDSAEIVEVCVDNDATLNHEVYYVKMSDDLVFFGEVVIAVDEKDVSYPLQEQALTSLSEKLARAFVDEERTRASDIIAQAFGIFSQQATPDDMTAYLQLCDELYAHPSPERARDIIQEMTDVEIAVLRRNN